MHVTEKPQQSVNSSLLKMWKTSSSRFTSDCYRKPTLETPSICVTVKENESNNQSESRIQECCGVNDNKHSNMNNGHSTGEDAITSNVNNSHVI